MDGLDFEIEPGVRIAQETERESYAVYAPEVVRLGDGSFRMFYAAWAVGIDGGVFTAVSDDGIEWTKSPRPLLDLDAPLDCGMVSEPCVIELPDGRCRMFYEARDIEGRARIVSATARVRPANETGRLSVLVHCGGERGAAANGSRRRERARRDSAPQRERRSLQLTMASRGRPGGRNLCAAGWCGRRCSPSTRRCRWGGGRS